MTSPEQEWAAARLEGSVLLVGPGWLGRAAAARMAALGAHVSTLQRTPAAATPGVCALVGDITEAARSPERLAALRSTLPERIDALVVCVAPSRARGDDYAMYPRAAAGAAALARDMRIPSVLYVSSTGVYDRQDGSEVTEQSPIDPRDNRVQALRDAEELIATAAFASNTSVHIVRAAGLYGPQRDPAARLTDPAFAASDVWCNFSWRDDVIAAMTHLLATDRAPGVRVYNCADGSPLRASEISATVTGRAANDRPMPTPPSHAGAAPVRSGRSNQRINVDALRATGWRPIAPTVFDGLRLLGHQVPFTSTGAPSATVSS